MPTPAEIRILQRHAEAYITAKEKAGEPFDADLYRAILAEIPVQDDGASIMTAVAMVGYNLAAKTAARIVAERIARLEDRANSMARLEERSGRDQIVYIPRHERAFGK